MIEIEGYDPERANPHPLFRELDKRLAETGDEEAWFAGVRELLETSYLAAATPYEQSGTSSDAQSWRRKRSPIVDAIDHDGTFLDIGCANGLLMETLTDWAAERGHCIEPYGLDLSPRLAAFARSRYPQWAERIWDGNGLTWRPPDGQRFDYVRTELEYVPLHRWRDFVAHLLDAVVAPGGRLIVCSYGSARRPAPRVQDTATILRGFGCAVAGMASAAAPNGITDVMVAWIDNAFS